MNSPPVTPSFLRTAAFGTLCGLFAALCYTACNACLRAAIGVDAFFVAGMRAVPTVALLAPVVLARPYYGLPMLPPARITMLLIVSGLLAHVAGNSLFQYSLSVVGMALAVPLCLGSIIFCGASLGRVVLNEPVTPRMALGLSLLIISIFILSGGAKAAQRSMQDEAAARVDQASESPARSADPNEESSAACDSRELLLGVAAACGSGLFYAAMGATIRHATQGLSTLSQTLTIVSTVGMVALAGICCWTMSAGELAEVTSWQLTAMLLAGLFNAMAFISLTRALQLTSLVYVHALNASQAAMAAIAGILLFGEATSAYLFAGLAFTIGGLFLMQGKHKPN